MSTRVSVITPTIRKEGLQIVKEALESQTYQNFEWLIGSKFDPGIDEAKWIQDNFNDGFWSLNRVYNELFKSATGDLIITLQDWIWIPEDGIEKFVLNNPKLDRVISGVGDQYESIDKMGNPQVKIWSDPRKTDKYGSFYECFPSDIEWNWAAMPRKAIFDVGGFCEELDFRGFGMDGYQVNERLDLLGYKFFIDQSNESFSIRHDRSNYGGETNWNKNNNLTNGEYQKVRQEFIKKGQWPRMKYLIP